MTDTCIAFTGHPPASRSRVGNGSRALEGVDARSRRGRRFRDVLDDLITEHGCVSESDIARCRAAAALMLAVEDMAAAAVNGETSDPAITARCATRLNRILNDLAARQRQRRRAAR